LCRIRYDIAIVPVIRTLMYWFNQLPQSPVEIDFPFGPNPYIQGEGDVPTPILCNVPIPQSFCFDVSLMPLRLVHQLQGWPCRMRKDILSSAVDGANIRQLVFFASEQCRILDHHSGQIGAIAIIFRIIDHRAASTSLPIWCASGHRSHVHFIARLLTRQMMQFGERGG
jgi:hypothetical protein